MISLDALSAQTHRQAMLAAAQFLLDRARTSVPADDALRTDEMIHAANACMEAYHAITTVWPSSTVDDDPAPDGTPNRRNHVHWFVKAAVSTLNEVREARPSLAPVPREP
jgi:hypothetical protein